MNLGLVLVKQSWQLGKGRFMHLLLLLDPISYGPLRHIMTDYER